MQTVQHFGNVQSLQKSFRVNPEEILIPENDRISKGIAFLIQ